MRFGRWRSARRAAMAGRQGALFGRRRGFALAAPGGGAFFGNQNARSDTERLWRCTLLPELVEKLQADAVALAKLREREGVDFVGDRFGERFGERGAELRDLFYGR